MKSTSIISLSTICCVLVQVPLKMVSSEIVIQTTSGPVKGVTTSAADVESFLGIPFAEPPIGDLRFRKPIAKKPWSEIFEASTLSPTCAQFVLDIPYYFLPNYANMSEDCLYLNVWTPIPFSNVTAKPVIIFIHPGAFYAGSASTFTFEGTNFARHSDVVVVTINYRLASLGFLHLDIEEADGNMGMYDQVMAIKWVKDNAKVFGGDPENIVLFGVSAGAISIGMHMVSPLSKNLFHKAIIHSGSLLLPYFYDSTRLLRQAKSLANAVGCSNGTFKSKTDRRSVVDCLKLQSSDSLSKAQRILMNTNPLLFFPRIHDAFLPESTLKLVRNGEFKNTIPVLTGFNENEGAFLITVAFPEYFGIYGKNGSEGISEKLVVFLLRSIAAIENISKPSEITDFYLSKVDDRSSRGFIKMVSDAVGDYSVSCNTLFTADFLSLKGNPVFFYKFNFRSPSTPMAEWVGVTHVDELQYVFGNPYHANFTEEEIDLSHRIMDRWSAFARTGEPNIPDHISWTRYSYEDPFYLSIEQDGERIRKTPSERCEFWRKRFGSEIDSDLIKFLQNA